MAALISEQRFEAKHATVNFFFSTSAPLALPVDRKSTRSTGVGRAGAVEMAAERGATGLWQRGGYECSCSGASHSQRTLGRWQAASPAELPRRQRRAARILTVCMARGARLAVRVSCAMLSFPGSVSVTHLPSNIAPMCNRPQQALCRSREEAHDKEQRHRAPGLGAGAHAEPAVPGAAGR